MRRARYAWAFADAAITIALVGGLLSSQSEAAPAPQPTNACMPLPAPTRPAAAPHVLAEPDYVFTTNAYCRFDGRGNCL